MHQHVANRDLRVSVAGLVLRSIGELYRLLRAPLNAGMTHLTVASPHGPPRFDPNVASGADPGTDPAALAAFVCAVVSGHGLQRAHRHPVEHSAHEGRGKIAALEGVGLLSQTIELVQEYLNPELTYEGIVLTMYDARTNLSEQVADETEDFFGDLVFETMIPRNVRLSEAPSYGQPIIEYSSSSRGAKSYRKFAREFLARNGVTAKAS